MANYIGVFRSNYFQVTDEEKFKGIVSRMSSGEGPVTLFTERAPYYGFGGDGSLSGVVSEDDAESDFPEADFHLMVQELQDILPDDEAIIIMSAGHEKFRYVSGWTCIITKDGYDYIDMTESAKEKAKELLKNEDWDTLCEY